ncbi:MAG: hypothetical protein U5J98_05630 [Halobacteriales archaeon]|nr:hypothetical protein [Halobacteriales archaeon]
MERADPAFPEVVCLCGSTRFKEAYRAENKRLTLEGAVVLSVAFFGHADGESVAISGAEKERLDAVHKRKIDLADRVHVINVDGYVGDSTRSEIAYARERDIPVTWLEPEHALGDGELADGG